MGRVRCSCGCAQDLWKSAEVATRNEVLHVSQRKGLKMFGIYDWFGANKFHVKVKKENCLLIDESYCYTWISAALVWSDWLIKT